MDDSLRARFAALSKNELVGIARTSGSRGAHKGLPVPVLLALIDEGGDADDPLDPHRREIMSFIADHRAQLTLPCHGDCFQHSWAQVLKCHQELTRKDIL